MGKQGENWCHTADSPSMKFPPHVYPLYPWIITTLLPLSWFLTRPNYDLLRENELTNSAVSRNTPGWQRKICPRTSALTACDIRGRVLPQQTWCRIKAKGWYFHDHTDLKHRLKSIWTSHKVPACVMESVTQQNLCLASRKLQKHQQLRSPDAGLFKTAAKLWIIQSISSSLCFGFKLSLMRLSS